MTDVLYLRLRARLVYLKQTWYMRVLPACYTTLANDNATRDMEKEKEETQEQKKCGLLGTALPHERICSWGLRLSSGPKCSGEGAAYSKHLLSIATERQMLCG